MAKKPNKNETDQKENASAAIGIDCQATEIVAATPESLNEHEAPERLARLAAIESRLPSNEVLDRIVIDPPSEWLAEQSWD